MPSPSSTKLFFVLLVLLNTTIGVGRLEQSDIKSTRGNPYKQTQMEKHTTLGQDQIII